MESTDSTRKKDSDPLLESNGNSPNNATFLKRDEHRRASLMKELSKLRSKSKVVTNSPEQAGHFFTQTEQDGGRLETESIPLMTPKADQPSSPPKSEATPPAKTPQKYKYFRRIWEEQTLSKEENINKLLLKKSKLRSTYTKLTNCLLSAMACVKLQRELEHARIYGTSLNQYKVGLRGKRNVKNALFFVDNKPSVYELVKSQKWVINPLSYYYVAWQAIQVSMIIYSMTFMPYAMVFYPDNVNIEHAELVMNVVFFCDVLATFFVPVIDSEDR